MRQRKLAYAAACLCAAALITTVSIADDKKPALDQNAMMEVYMKAATPGPVHAEMAKMAGKWKLDVTSWMAPGAPPEKSTGTAEFKTILGGRFLQQEVKSEMGGMPFEGMGIEGYDNVSKERFGMWVDNMGTGGMVMKGKCGVGEKVCKFSGSYNDPMTGKAKRVREVLTMNNDNSFAFEMWGPDEAGKEFKVLQIVYTRG